MRMTLGVVLFVATLLCCPVFFSSNALSQSPLVQTIVAPVNQLSIGDIDFRHSTTPRWLFTVIINLNGIDSVTMKIVAGFVLSGGETYSNALEFETVPFLVNGTRSVTNLDLDRTVPIKPGSYIFNTTAKRRLEETALPTGRLPAGTYNFNVTVTPVHGSVLTAFPPIAIIVSNPSTVELISPVDGDQFASSFPLFQWLYDGPSSRVSVYEKLPGQASLEEAASGIPHYSTTSTSNSLQYPSSGARLLEPGKTYVWFVEGLSGVAGGTTVSLKSSLRSFMVASNGAQSLSSILDELGRALPQYQSLFDEIKAQGFTTATTLRLNGSIISVSDLQRLVNKLRLNPDAVTSVELE